MTGLVLRPYQEDCITGIRRAFIDGYHSPLLVAPTGSGKTVMFSYLTQRIAAAGQSAWIMAHREELLDQIAETIDEFEVRHGRIARDYLYDRRLRVQVASVMTLVRRLDRVALPDYLICDEAHHGTMASSWGKVIRFLRERNPKLRVIGVTATPERLSGEGLGETFDTMILGPTTGELIDLGALSPFRLCAPPGMGDDFAGVGKLGGDFNKKGVAEVIGREKAKIVGNAVSHYRKFLNGAPAVAFCHSVEAAEDTAALFRAEGFRSVSIDGNMERGLRRDLVRDFKNGAVNVLTSCDLISEGFDLPGIVGAILLRPTQSLALYLQQVGRALRTAPGKTHAMILDHVGNSSRHGLPDAEREWSLTGRGSRKTKAGEAAVRQCPFCYAISPAAALKCRDCGQAFPVQARTLEQVDGELTEIEVARAKQAEKKAAFAATSMEALAELYRMMGKPNPEWRAAQAWEKKLAYARYTARGGK